MVASRESGAHQTGALIAHAPPEAETPNTAVSRYGCQSAATGGLSHSAILALRRSSITVLLVPTLTFKVTAAEARQIRTLARREKLSVSEYLRRKASGQTSDAVKPKLVRCEFTGAMIFGPVPGQRPLTTDDVKRLHGRISMKYLLDVNVLVALGLVGSRRPRSYRSLDCPAGRAGAINPYCLKVFPVRSLSSQPRRLW